MFDHTHYVPVLKAKSGEFDALEMLDASVKERITPLIELTPIPLKWLENQDEPVPTRTIDEHIDWLADRIATSWKPDVPIFIDGWHIETEDVLSDNTEPIEGVLSRLRNRALNCIPVVGIDRVGEYLDVVAQFAENGCDVCVRLKPQDLENTGSLDEQVFGLLSHLKIPESRGHLVVDFRSITPAVASALKVALPFQLAAVPSLTKWKTVTLAASAFPADLSEVSKYSLDTFSRAEWDIWAHLRQTKDKLKRLPTFGDYTVTHPELSVFDPRTMSISPKIKYTDTLQWVVAKGEAHRRKKSKTKSAPAKDQYPHLCKMIIDHPAWKSADFSKGDEYIAKCKTKEVGPGNPQKWVTVGAVHHIAFVVRQLANPF